MIKGLTGAGVGSFDSLESFVVAAARHGFGSVDAGGEEIRRLLERKGEDCARDFLLQHDVKVGCFGLPVEWRAGEEQFRSGLIQLATDAEAASRIGCTACCTYVLPSTDLEAVRFMAIATRRIRQCAQILDAYGIRFGLEFVGPHHLRTAWKHPFLWDQDSFLDWFDAINEKNVGFLYDAYHWYTNGGTVEDILRLRSDQIVYAHINDAKPVPVAEALDNDRLFPGEGVIDLVGFLKALNQIGYKGVIAQEILTPKPILGSQEDKLIRSATGFRKVYRAAGLE
ncbi:MAG: sugar phosphate isomerase/epimerase [Gorillibacterium sp.]|nr:sugar phosphate isomerase/epimerase [Gorillibacterium sp.]